MVAVRATVDGAIRIEGDVEPKFHARLVRSFSFGNPAFYRLQSMGRAMSYSDVPERIEAALEAPDGRLVIPRGGVALVKSVVEGKGGRVEFIDRRTRGRAIEIPKRHDEGDEPIALRPYQRTALDEIKRRTQGLVVIGCGGGKTTIGIVAIEELARSAVVLVHTGDLLDQWVEGLRDKLGIEAGVIADGKVTPGDVTVGMIQTVSKRLDDPLVSGVLEGAGVVVLDEAHHAPAAMFRRVLDRCPARWRLGLTATPKREDGMTRIVDWSFGERLIERPSKWLLRHGYLMQPTLEVIPTDFRFDSSTTDKFKRSTEIAQALEVYEPRLHLIASVAAAHVKGGERVLVLANRKGYARTLGRLIWEYGGEAFTVTGDTAKKARKDLIAKFRSGECPCLVATSLANEGLDAPKLSRIVFAWPEKAAGATDQKTGRLMRIAQKVPILIDFVDVHVDQLVRRYTERSKVYRALGMNPPKPTEIET